MHFSFEVKDTGISPYAVFMLLSFIVSFSIAYILMVKKQVNKTLAFFSTLLNFILAMYCGYLFAFITSEEKSFRRIGFASIGGLIGVIIGTLILSILFKEYKAELWKAYSTVIPLTYSISKMGCFFVGCCYGIKYNGIFSVTYHGNRPKATEVELFPVQLTETVVFLLIFILGLYLVYIRSCNHGIYVILGLCAIGKFSLDYLRESHQGIVLSVNQVMCILVVIIAITIGIIDNYRKRKNATSTN